MPQPRQHPDNAERQRAYRARQAAARRDDPHPAQPRPLAGPPGPDPHGPGGRTALAAARDELQAYHDDRSPAWQAGERAAALLEHLDALAQLLDDLDALPPF